MTIKYYRKNVYGNELIYLVEGEGTREVLGLICQKTIQLWQIAAFEKLGVKFEETFAPRQ